MATLAARQYGVAAHWQLIALGFSAAAIQRRVRSGALHRLYKGVYAVGHTVLRLEGRWMAAVLACGPGALLSHRDGGALHNLRRDGRARIDVTASRTRAGHRGIELHRPLSLHPDDRASVEGIPVTSVARTLFDMAAVLRPDQVERAFEQAELRKLLDLGALEAVLARNEGRPGIPVIRALIANARPFVPMTRSELERLFLRICREADLPEPAMNLWVCGHEADALFAAQGLVVEIDGGDVHGTRAARRRDPLRDADLQIGGYRVLRVSEDWMLADRAGVARAVRKMLEAAAPPHRR